MRATDFLTLTGWPVEKFPEKREKLCQHFELYVAMVTPSTLAEVSQEVAGQRAKWGEQNHPDFHPRASKIASKRHEWYGLPSENFAKAGCEFDAEAGTTNWCRILVEEVCEATSAPSEELLRKELVQVAATAVSWIDAIDRRKAQATPEQA